MKKFILFMSLVISSVVWAQTQPKPAAQPRKTSVPATKFKRPYGMAGCGLGSLIMGKDGGQVLAATSNGSSSNQTFGISAGTSNCVDTPKAEVAGRLDQFILVNRSQIQGDIARGSGETILALEQYLGCENQSAIMGAELKANYQMIFQPEAQANQITDSIISTILESNELAQSCNKLG
jgi:hypothetical protein